MSWHLSHRVLTIGAAVVIFAGCGGPPIGGNPELIHGPQARRDVHFIEKPSWDKQTELASSEYKTSGPLLFVVNFVTNSTPGDVDIYDAKANNPNPIAVITTGLFQPNGACIDGSGTLYVGNDPASGSGWISEYRLGQTKPARTLTKGINTPAFCAIDADGNLWVANAGGVNVTEYLKGSVKPHATITQGLTNPDGIAIDKAGNLYVGNLVPYDSNVQVYAPGSKSPARTITAGVTWPVGIGVDPNGTLYVTNDVQCNVEEYRAGQSKPYRELTDEINGPNSVTFSKHGTLYEVNAGFNGCSGPWPVVLEFRPGSVKPSKRMISTGLHTPVGSAYYPPLLP